MGVADEEYFLFLSGEFLGILCETLYVHHCTINRALLSCYRTLKCNRVCYSMGGAFVLQLFVSLNCQLTNVIALLEMKAIMDHSLNLLLTGVSVSYGG